MATWRPVTLIPDNGWGPLPPHATAPPPRRSRVLRWLERVLLAIGITCLGYYAYVSAETALYQAYEMRELDAILASVPEPEPDVVTPAASTVPATRTLAPGSAVGRIEIPRLGVSAVVRAGSDARTLRLAVGHIPGTALPGERGNVGLAAHRDTFFRRLGEIRPDDEVRLVTRDGTFTYHVDGTRIVEPSDVWVLDDTAQPSLTLVTCYPFTFVGSAPRRFIVRAQLVHR
jgi:sortase A